jgi:hypothetical protein
MFRRALLMSLLLLPACATSPEKKAAEEAAAAAEATDKCPANPKLAEEWGECNVKRTIYSRMAAIGVCQRTYAKGSRPGDALVLKIRIKPDGSVRDVKADDSVHPTNKKLEACLAKEIGRLRFAKPPRGVKPVVYYPYQP